MSAELTLTEAGLEGVAVGPTGTLVGVGDDVGAADDGTDDDGAVDDGTDGDDSDSEHDVIAVVPDSTVVGGGVEVKVHTVTVEFLYAVVVWLIGGGMTYVDVVVTGGGVCMTRVHGQLVMVMVVDSLTV